MNDFERVATVLKEHLQDVRILDKHDLHNYAIKLTKIRNTVYDWICDKTCSTESIIYLLDTYLNSIEGFSTNWDAQTHVAVAILEGLVCRNPEVLNGEWEKVAWIMIKYSAELHSYVEDLLSPNGVGSMTTKWINHMFSTKKCPNPCLRLELLRFMSCFDMHKRGLYWPGFFSELMSTIYELYDNHSHFAVDQLPMCTATDLMYALRNYVCDIRNLLDLESNRTIIIAAFFKVTKMFAILEKERYDIYNNLPISTSHWRGQMWSQVYLQNQLGDVCSNFFGLTIHAYDEFDYGNGEYIYGLTEFINIVSANRLLQEYVLDTLNILTDISQSLIKDTRYVIVRQRDRILENMIEAEKFRLPMYLCHREVHGITLPCANLLKINVSDEYSGRSMSNIDEDSEIHSLDEYMNDSSIMNSNEDEESSDTPISDDSIINSDEDA
ncbi:unnamed protein product [Meganyctiphanes norvegica]|uniref:Uncharacterized protein n=1 Tax=Meganyctiphanes norvegica TaxID=48144 RepID=A0AAV2QAL2_MEGNR